MNKSAIVFGGTHDHIHLVRLLKDRGFEVVLFDNTPSPAAQKYCCKKIKLNFSHLCGARKECLKINPSLALAISVDRAIPVAAYISESLNLPFYITDDTAAILSDKVEIKDRLRASGIPTADYYRDFDKNINKLKYPLIVKPVDANSSKGVMRVDEYSHLSRAIEYAREISQSNKVLIEEFIIGDEYSIDAVVQDGKTRVITITKVNKLPNANKFVINENIFSIRTHKRLLKQASTLVSAICKTFRLENSPLLIQAILNKDGQLMVVELSARVGVALNIT